MACWQVYRAAGPDLYNFVNAVVRRLPLPPSVRNISDEVAAAVHRIHEYGPDLAAPAADSAHGHGLIECRRVPHSRAAYHALRPRLYGAIMLAMAESSNDAIVQQATEVWLSFIQPWQYATAGGRFSANDW